MKRLFYCSAVLLTMGFFTSCDQHDPNSPDTSGGYPTTSPNVGVDTAITVPQGTSPNMSNDQTNKDQDLSTTDTTRNNQ